MSRPLLVIVGPTCTGKTALAVALAGALDPAELLNADSRQTRRGLRIGTCAPAPAELKGIPCSLLDLCEPGEDFTVADWLDAARDCLGRLDRTGSRAVVVGGTGLYVTALVDGFDLARVPPDPERRGERTELASTQEGLETLVAELRRRDPEGAEAVDLRNPRRVIRALEILDARGGSVLAARGRASPRPALMIGLDLPRPEHTRWIERRAADMFQGGIQEEVDGMLRAGLDRETIAACGIGYREALDTLEGRLGLDAAVAATVQRTLRYARAQRTWFRRDSRIRWFRPDAAGVDLMVGAILELDASL